MSPDQIAAMRGTSISRLVREQRLAERFEAAQQQQPFSSEQMNDLAENTPTTEADDLPHAKLAIAFALGFAVAQETNHVDD